MGSKTSKDAAKVFVDPNERYSAKQRQPGNWGWWTNDVIKRVGQNDPSLGVVRLPAILLGSDGVKEMVNALQANYTVREWDAARNQFNAAAVLPVARCLIANTHLHTLNLNFNPLGPEGILHFLEPLLHNEYLQTLHLNTCALGVAGAKTVAAIIQFNNSITDLELSGNNLEAKGARHIGSALAHTFCLQRLRLGRNDIGDAGTKDLATGLNRNRSLKLLDISSNNIGPKVYCYMDCTHLSVTCYISTMAHTLFPTRPLLDMHVARMRNSLLGVVFPLVLVPRRCQRPPRAPLDRSEVEVGDQPFGAFPHLFGFGSGFGGKGAVASVVGMLGSPFLGPQSTKHVV